MRQNRSPSRSTRSATRALCIAFIGAVSGAFIGAATPAQAEGPGAIQNRSIGYVTTAAHWAVGQSPDGKTECPDGFNDFGPREIFKELYPDPTKHTVMETELSREAMYWFPDGGGHDAKFPFHDAKGTVAPGMNLDGKVGPNDFTGPLGEKGIDNQLTRVVGCSRFYRAPDGTYYIFADKYAREFRYNRAMIEITNLDSLTNDDDVDVNIYRGLDRLMQDATGNNIVAGGTEHVDARFAKKFEAHLKGKIKDGVLTTQPADVFWMWSCFGGVPGGEKFHDMRFNLKLTPEGAKGMIGGYADIDNWYFHLIGCQSTHHLSYGQLSSTGLYNSLRRNADAYPAKDGHNTAISGAVNLEMAQVFIIHPDKQVAETDTSKSRPRATTSSGQ